MYFVCSENSVRKIRCYGFQLQARVLSLQLRNTYISNRDLRCGMLTLKNKIQYIIHKTNHEFVFEVKSSKSAFLINFLRLR